MREITKNIDLEIDGEQMNFIIKKMNAFDGAYLMKLMTEKVLPLFKGAVDVVKGEQQKENAESEIDHDSWMKIFDMLPGVLASLDEKETKRLMSLCLNTVSCLLQAGYQEVVDSRGYFCVEELEYNTAACLRLTYEVIVFNCADFFNANSLGSILGSLNGFRPTL